MQRLISALLLLLLPALAQAQGWQLQTHDDGSYFTGAIIAPEGSQMTLLCGERSPRGMSPHTTGNTEPDITPTGAFRLYLSEADIGAPDPERTPRSDVMIVAGSTGYKLRSVKWDELFAVWYVDLVVDDALFSAMSAVPVVELRSEAGTRRTPAAGFDRAVRQLGQYCRSMFLAIGKSWDGRPDVTEGAMRQAAEASIELGCNGPADREPGYLQTGNIDGDGIEDAVLDWSRVTCLSGPPRPYCGASECTAGVFLSARYVLQPEPIEFLAMGPSLRPLTNGNMGISSAERATVCQERGLGACESILYWNGYDLQKLR
ncbi:hypothetical protein [Albibacillus kandeliae]|uniref:hypothetical protein n=1 Tax=Albibacillus kandeliae TaxID=2174228 RepID=UPI0013005D78|nr:hypothetical protein [Albibacillus kandeliae]